MLIVPGSTSSRAGGVSETVSHFTKHSFSSKYYYVDGECGRPQSDITELITAVEDSPAVVYSGACWPPKRLPLL